MLWDGTVGTDGTGALGRYALNNGTLRLRSGQVRMTRINADCLLRSGCFARREREGKEMMRFASLRFFFSREGAKAQREGWTGGSEECCLKISYKLIV